MHPHVVERLFFGPASAFKMDLYVVNWRLNGLSAQRGWLTDGWYTSHNAYSDYNVYNEEVQAAIDLMIPSGGGNYNKVLGYGHSNGAPILLNYLVEKGDDRFDGFLFNSPFLGFGTTYCDEFNARYTSAVLRFFCSE